MARHWRRPGSRRLTKKHRQDQGLAEAIESEHSDPKNDKSPTFGELIKEGKLPGG